jgi:hypothetical protein
MSLTSASGVITGMKEYIYRGMQQLPIVLASSSLLFTVTTGSIAHLNLFLGLSFLMPLYTFGIQCVLGLIMPKLTNDITSWKRATGDTCDLVGTSRDKGITLEKFMDKTNATSPSYWITSVGFFFGYAVSNIVDSFKHPSSEGASDVSKERRNHHSMFIAINLSVFFLLILGTRLWFMKGCDGLGPLGVFISYLSAVVAFWLGYGIYEFSKACGARSTDLFGVLSQLLPDSAGAKNPIVCTSD